jgi:hypothetical protein
LNFVSVDDWAPEVSDELFSSWSESHHVNGSEDGLFLGDEELVNIDG